MRNQRMRQLGVITLASVLAAGMLGCGSTTGTTTDAAGEAATEAAATDSTAAVVFELSGKDATEGSTEAGEESSEAATEASTEEVAAESDTESSELTVSGTGARKRRTLPHKTTSDEADTEDAEEEDNTVSETYPTSVEEISRPRTYKGDTVSFKEVKGVTDSIATWENDGSYPDSQEDMEQILSGLMTYWADGNMESVDYLVRMGKYRYLSQLLDDGSGDYFYVGEENAAGEPDGTGIAVYANNAYYYGEFQDGERSGNGFWYQIFVEDGAYSKANNGIIGHSYNGEWANDLPNGKGQEHLDIDTAYLSGRIITNVATDYVDGYYNGDIIATSLEKDEGMTNWTGAAHYGTMVAIGGDYVENADGDKQVRVLQNADDADNYYWMLLDENCGQGITGLIPD